MAHWKHKIDLSDVFDIHEDDGQKNAQEAGKIVAQRLRQIKISDPELDSLIIEFDELGSDDIDEFDNIMEDLYNYGEIGRAHV